MDAKEIFKQCSTERLMSEQGFMEALAKLGVKQSPVIKHTAGPWCVNYGGSIGHIKAILACGQTPTVCKFDNDSRAFVTISDEEALANAILMASAPRMKSALLDIVNLVGEYKISVRVDGMAMSNIGTRAKAALSPVKEELWTSEGDRANS